MVRSKLARHETVPWYSYVIPMGTTTKETSIGHHRRSHRPILPLFSFWHLCYSWMWRRLEVKNGWRFVLFHVTCSLQWLLICVQYARQCAHTTSSSSPCHAQILECIRLIRFKIAMSDDVARQQQLKLECIQDDHANLHKIQKHCQHAQTIDHFRGDMTPRRHNFAHLHFHPVGLLPVYHKAESCT